MGFISSYFKPKDKPKPSMHASIDTTSGKADGEALLDTLLPFAEKMLRKHREFFPFGGSMNPSGEIVHEGAYDGSEQPPSQDLIDLLRESHQKSASEKQLRACATVYEIRTIPPGLNEKQDAIAVEIDHFGGYSVVVIFPYSFTANGDLSITAPFATQGDRIVFPED